MKSVYIHGGLRSPIGRCDGQYKMIPAEQLGLAVLQEVVDRFQVDPIACQGILCGNAVGTGGNIGRFMALHDERFKEVPVTTLDMQCASSGSALHMGTALIRSGMSDQLIVGGMESSSLQPTRIFHERDSRQGAYMVAPFAPETNLPSGEPNPLAMLEGAEGTAIHHGFTRKELDGFALRSHQLGSAHHSNLSPVIARMKYLSQEGTWRDESLRSSMSERLLQRMPSLLGPSSLTTAGNSCLTHDGAAWLLLSQEAGPYRIVHSIQWAGSHPERSPEGALAASTIVLKQVGLPMEAMDVVEWNEAFAVISGLFQRSYPHVMDRYNAWGGALAYGHPYGASGAIIVLHAMARLEAIQGRYALCAIAGAGGTGTACIIEKV